MSGIRVGDVPDMKAIVELGRELLAESVYSNVKTDEQAFRMFVAGLMGSSRATVILVVDDDDKPQGFLLGIVDDLFFSRARYGTDLAFYVRDRYRRYAPRMLKQFIDWAKSKPRVDHILLGQSSGIGDLDRVGEMYEKIGLARVGGIYYQKV